MALEKWRRTERMREGLDAFKAEFGTPQQKGWESYTDHMAASQAERDLATKYAKEEYELKELIAEKTERLRTIEEWQMRFYSQYPHESMVAYVPPPKKEVKPKVTKPYIVSVNTPKEAFPLYKGLPALTMEGKVVGAVTDIVIEQDMIDATVFGGSTSYLTGLKTATLTATFQPDDELLYMIQKGASLSIGIDKHGPSYGGGYYDPFYEGIAKYKAKYTLEGKQADSVTVDELKTATEQIKKTTFPKFLKPKKQSGK